MGRFQNFIITIFFLFSPITAMNWGDSTKIDNSDKKTLGKRCAEYKEQQKMFILKKEDREELERRIGIITKIITTAPSFRTMTDYIFGKFHPQGPRIINLLKFMARGKIDLSDYELPPTIDRATYNNLINYLERRKTRALNLYADNQTIRVQYFWDDKEGLTKIRDCVKARMRSIETSKSLLEDLLEKSEQTESSAAAAAAAQ